MSENLRQGEKPIDFYMKKCWELKPQGSEEGSLYLFGYHFLPFNSIDLQTVSTPIILVGVST